MNKYLRIFSISIFISFCYDASAQLRFVNYTTSDIYVSIMYPQNEEWLVEGWYKIAPDADRSLIENLTNRYYYYYVSSDDKTWPGKDTKGTIHPTKSFKTSDQQNYNSSDGYKEVGFTKIDTKGKDRYSEYIRREFIFIGDNRYECSSSFGFQCEGISLDKVSIRFTKNNDGSSYVLLNSNMHYVVGTTLLYLDDGSIIKMYDKNRRDSFTEGHETNKISIYYLTKSEVNSIKKSNIASIRYNTSPFSSSSSGHNEGHIVHNKSCRAGYEFGGEGYDVDRIRFDVELTQLIN